MPTMEHGFNRAVTELVAGGVTYLVVQTLLRSFGYSYLAISLNILSIVAIIGLIDVIPFWSIGYLVGWIFGLIIIGPPLIDSLIDWWELLSYVIIGGFFLWIKFKNKFS
jgi:hypothetical protein